MSFRTRILATSILLVWAPLLVLAWITREEMKSRLTEEHDRRVADMVEVFESDLDQRNELLAERLADLRARIEDDNQFRLGAVEGIIPDPAYILDYAGQAMQLMGLSVLQIQDGSGRILSSGHFRNEYGRSEPALPGLLGRIDEGALVRFRKPEGTLLAFSRVDSLALAGKKFFLVGGFAFDRVLLESMTRDRDFSVSLIGPGAVASSSEELHQRLLSGMQQEGWDWTSEFPTARFRTRTVNIPFALYGGDQPPKLVAAYLVGAYSRAPLTRILQNLDLWLLAVMVATVLGTWLLSYWVAARISRPLIELAEKTSLIDLDRGADFRTTRSDEIGDLSRFLSAMMARLRIGARKLRDAERRATLGELARQVNHDVRNGLTPIRNAMRHLDQVAREEPGSMVEVWNERAEALKSSIEYLDGLAENYGRLYRQNPRRPCDLNTLVREQAGGQNGNAEITVDVRLGKDLPPVLADPIALRRILDNLVTNAVESFQTESGKVILETGFRPAEDLVTLSVFDNGPGIPEADQGRIFGDFFTTKTHGTGLGLSIVRRLVADCDGSIQVESRPGEGTRFDITFPAAGVSRTGGSPEQGPDR